MSVKGRIKKKKKEKEYSFKKQAKIFVPGTIRSASSVNNQNVPSSVKPTDKNKPTIKFLKVFERKK
jgi:hypothetical protein